MGKGMTAVLVAQGALAGISAAGSLYFAVNNHPFYSAYWAALAVINAGLNFRNIRRLSW